MTEKNLTFDCLVVGGGLLGLMTARFLAESGVAVAILEQGQVGSESSWAGGGILSPLEPWAQPDRISDVVAWSQSYYPELAERLLAETGVDVEWRKCGLLMAGMELTPEIEAWCQRYHCNVDVLDERASQSLQPGIRPGLGGSLYFPDIAQVRNPRLSRALHRSLEINRVPVFEHTPVTGLVIESGRAVGVVSGNKRFSAGKVVVSAGAWSSGILEATGFPLSVEPVCGQMLLLKTEPGSLRTIVMHGNRYLIPRCDGLVLVGSTLEKTGFRKEVTASVREELVSFATGLFPGLSDAPVVRQWAGLRPGSPGGVPYIAGHPSVSGLYLNTGHFRNGVVMAPGSARLLVDILLERQSFLPADSFPVAG